MHQLCQPTKRKRSNDFWAASTCCQVLLSFLYSNTPSPLSALPVPAACCLIPGAGPCPWIAWECPRPTSVPWLASLPSSVSPVLHRCAWLWDTSEIPALQVCVRLWLLLFIPCATCVCIIIWAGLLMKLTYWLGLLEFLCAVLHMLSC